MTNIWKTGIEADARYSKFNSAFASGTYQSFSITRNVSEKLRINAQVGKYDYSSSLATNSNSFFVNIMSDLNLGSRFFVENAFTTQRGGTQQYDQWTSIFGYRFDNRKSGRRFKHDDTITHDEKK